MAVLAVFLLLALVGARAGEEQQGAPGAPTPTPTPTPTSIPAAASAAGASTTESPPTPPPELSYDVPPIPPPRMSEVARPRDQSLYKYALLNLARTQGRGIVHGKRGDTEDPCMCGDKLYEDAMQYRQWGAVERWCIEYPEDLEGLGSDDDDDYDDEDYHLSSEDMDAASSYLYDTLKCTETMPAILLPSTSGTQSFPNRRTQPIITPSSSRQISSAACDPEPASLAFQNFDRQSVKQTVDDRYTVHSSGLPSSTEETGNQGSSGRSPREIQAARSLVSMLSSEVELHVVNEQGDNEIEPMDEPDIPDESMEVDDEGSDGASSEGASVGSDIVEPGTSDSYSYDSEEYDSASTPDDFMDVVESNNEADDLEPEGEDYVSDLAAEVAVGVPTQEEEEGITRQTEGDTTMEEAGSLQLPAATPEPQPGPSRVWRPPSPNTPNISFPEYLGTRYSRNRESLIYSAAGYPGSETAGPFSSVDWKPPPPKDVNKELDRIFGVQADNHTSNSVQPELQYCLGELKVAVLGTNIRPLYMVYVQCHREPNICPPPTVCTSIINSVTVSRRKDVPIQQQTFRLMGDPKDEWEPANVKASSGCFCAPPNYLQKLLSEQT